MYKTLIFREKVHEMFGEKYDISEAIYKNNITKVNIKCNIHDHYFEQTPKNLLLAKNGCIYCQENNKIYNNKTLEQFISECKIIHGDLYDYSKSIYINNKTKLDIWCKECSEFFSMRPDSHLINKNRCPRCYGNTKLTTDEYINRCLYKHGFVYDYSKTIYNGMNKNIFVICNTHGLFNINAQTHVNGAGCRICKNKEKLTLDKFINKSKELYNDLYDYSKVEYIKNNKSKVIIICKSHGEFLKSPNAHMSGQGCPICSMKISKGEQYFINIFKNNNIEYIYQKEFDDCVRKRKLKYDFYLPNENICIEVDGIQHSVVVEYFGGIDKFIIQKDIDNIKDNYCYENNIKLLRVDNISSYTKFKKDADNILKNNNILQWQKKK